MTFRTLVTVAALLLPLSCGSQTESEIETGAAAEAATGAPDVGAAPAPFAGTFRVSGRTVEEASGASRDIAGTVILVQDGEEYTASFEFETLFPTPDGGSSEAQVVGTGQGRLDGGELVGTADTQIILAQVPGVDADFAFLPRQYGPRITSESTTRLNDDGSLTIEIQSQAADGQEYRATRTTVRGTRISPVR